MPKTKLMYTSTVCVHHVCLPLYINMYPVLVLYTGIQESNQTQRVGGTEAAWAQAKSQPSVLPEFCTGCCLFFYPLHSAGRIDWHLP